MAKKKAAKPEAPVEAREAEPMLITRVIETNYMPYTMSVIVSRALPEIDGFKPSHRKLLYTMYKQGLLKGIRMKSSAVVGATMKLNPHGDGAIYETMVRLTRGNGALLHPFVDSKGNFGKVGSRDMAYAASRYTEVKLEAICSELFEGIDEEMVDLVDNFDGTMKEPVLLPTSFPNILVSANMGIAVGMASRICGFNLREVCETTIGLLKDPEFNIYSTLKAPDFPTGGELIYDRNALEQVYETGMGSFRVRSVWHYDRDQNCIEVTEIPYTATVEAIIDKTAALIKDGTIKEIADMRNETDLNGLKIAIDLKRGVDPDKLMAKLSKLTQLTDNFPCNFNIIIEGTPKVMGIREILTEWIAWRVMCIERQLHFRLRKMRVRLHLLEGLSKILLDIDKAIAIIRGTEEDSEVIPNLMIGFGIDEEQADFIAEIKLRNINKEYILNRLSETEKLKDEIDEMEDTLRNRKKIKTIIAKQLADVAKRFGKERCTRIVYDAEDAEEETESGAEEYPVVYFLTEEGYFKKISPAALQRSGEQKLKEGDRMSCRIEGNNADELLFFTNRHQVYKVISNDIAENKVAMLGLYLPQLLGLESGESICAMAVAPKGEYRGSLLFVFRDGKCARVLLSSYETKTNRKKLTGAYSDKAPLAAIIQLDGEEEIFIRTSADRGLLLNTAALAPKPTRSTAGVKVVTLKARQSVASAVRASSLTIKNPARFRTRTLPAAGALVRSEDLGVEQTTLE
ncbi:MAG: DNA topoisomerase (ATP-hydrolyzing) subunit A [Clostridiales bacterium]|nr:DNA topoisomerase (ATP-hydrolyzing) subunit A [Clostridiales bacterium]